jgi:nicotinamide riboside kinase
MPNARKIAFIGSHAVRKTNAVHSFAGAVGRSGRSVEVGREVVRYSPLGINERATPEAQLWVIMSQIREELELRHRADVLVLDRAVVDNFAYYLRVTQGADPYDVRPLVARWSTTYDLYVRLRPDVALVADGVRSTNERFRKEIERILDVVVPQHVAPDRLVELWASEVTDSFDWAGLVERLCGPRPEVAPPAPDTVALRLWDEER